jgi:hypothetical protein
MPESVERIMLGFPPPPLLNALTHYVILYLTILDHLVYALLFGLVGQDHNKMYRGKVCGVHY